MGKNSLILLLLRIAFLLFWQMRISLLTMCTHLRAVFFDWYNLEGLVFIFVSGEPVCVT